MPLSPQYLKEGDKVTIISTARKVSISEIEPAVHVLASWGLEVKTGKNLFKEFHQFAGSDQTRIDELQDALDDQDIGGQKEPEPAQDAEGDPQHLHVELDNRAQRGVVLVGPRPGGER